LPGIEIGPLLFSWLAWNIDRVLPVASFSFAEGFSVLFLGAFTKLRKATASCPSVHPAVCPHGTTRLPLDGV
jgi:hypothetical protein